VDDHQPPGKLRWPLKAGNGRAWRYVLEPHCATARQRLTAHRAVSADELDKELAHADSGPSSGIPDTCVPRLGVDIVGGFGV